jgi:hypothetical protein
MFYNGVIRTDVLLKGLAKKGSTSMTENIIAYCGLDCTTCPAYIATQNNDMQALKLVAEQWSQEFNVSIPPEGCICDGCLGAGRKIAHCDECAARSCAVERGVVNCAHCDDYGCQTLADFWKMAPQTKATLERIRANLH